MGNEQSTQKKRQKANPAETKVQNGELNGHVLPPADLPTPVANKEAIQQNIEIPPVADTKEPKPSTGKEETDSKKDKVPDKVPAHVETTPEKEMTAATKAEPTKEAPKPTGEEVTSFFGKMFKKIPEPVKSAAENKDSVDGQVTAADLKNDLQSDTVLISADQEEILEEATEKLALELIDAIQMEHLFEEHTDSTMLTQNLSQESSGQQVKVVPCLEILSDACRTMEPEIHVEHLKSVEEEIEVKVPVSFEHEEPQTPVTEKSLMEDKELIQIVETILSEGEEQLATENVTVSFPVKPKCEGTKQLTDADKTLSLDSEPASISENMKKDANEVDSVAAKAELSSAGTTEALSHVEEPVAGTEEATPVVREILPVTEGHILGAETVMEEPALTIQKKAIVEETIRQVNVTEVISEEPVLRNNFTEMLVVAKEPETTSTKPYLIVEACSPVAMEPTFAAEGNAAVDEEGWVIIDDPPQSQNISALSDEEHLDSVEEPLSSSTKEAEERISMESKTDLAGSAKLLSQLKSVCIKTLEDASYKPRSVNVNAVKDTVHITIGVYPTLKDELACADKVSDNTDVVTAAGNNFTRKIQGDDVGCSTEPVDVNSSTKPDPEPEGEALKPSPEKPTEENNPSQEDKAVEKTVMNFFKTFASSTKTSKEGKATGDASKEQSQKETPPAPSTNVQEAPKAPPPPPPAPPKMESKAEPAVKKEEATASASAAATKAAEGSSKTKSFSKLFRPKVLLGKVVSKVHSATSGASGPAKTSGVHVVVEEKKPVEVQVDASKTSTLEAAAKPEEPPAPKPKPEEKKPEKKSAFGGLFKPKVLLGQMSARIQAAASSAAASVSLVSAGSAPEPKKESPAPPAVAETAPVVKAKEEPKPAAPAPAAPDNKSVESTDNASPSTQRKLEKRNSIQLFFKTLVK